MKNRTAIYCRLSREDEKNSISTSIKNQQDFLIEYLKKNNFKLFKTYIDDGYSGGNFERPGFKSLIEDIKNNNIDIVLVKDLSRLGRNYLEVGYYTEDFFPSHNIRFIAVNDNYDSLNGEDDITPFKNIINQWYLKDISKKVKSVHEIRMKKGILPKGNFIPLFGYQYDDTNERVIDPNSAKVVKKVFELYNNGYSPKRIKEEMIKNKMTTPSYYNFLKYNYNCEYWMYAEDDKKYDWNSQVINRIVSNKEYTGILELKKRQTISYKTHKRRLSKEEEKYIFIDRFPAIISLDTWEKAKTIKKSKIHTSKYKDDILNNLVYCGNCYNALSYIKSGNNLYLGCRRKNCSHHTRINYRTIFDILLKEAKNKLQSLISNKDLETEYKKHYASIGIEVENLKLRNKRIETSLLRLQKEYIDENISSDIFNKLTTSYLNEINKNKKILQEKDEKKEFDLFYLFIKHEITDNKLIKFFIDRVEVYDDEFKKKVKIYFNKSL